MVFSDSTGRKFTISLDGDLAFKWKDECEVNVFELLSDQAKLTSKLMSDVFAQMELVWLACEGQHGITTRKEFMSILAGDVLNDACNALWQEITNFFPRQETRELFGALLEKGKRVANIVETTSLKMIQATSEQEVAKTLSDGSFSLLESQESTQES